MKISEKVDRHAHTLDLISLVACCLYLALPGDVTVLMRGVLAYHLIRLITIKWKGGVL